MRIIAYTYEADVHCVECAKRQFGYGPEAMSAALKLPMVVEFDEHGILVNCTDSEGNEIHPVFLTDEQLEPLHCGDCGEEIE